MGSESSEGIEPAGGLDFETFWYEALASARVDLGLSFQEFEAVTPRLLHALYKRKFPPSKDSKTSTGHRVHREIKSNKPQTVAEQRSILRDFCKTIAEARGKTWLESKTT